MRGRIKILVVKSLQIMQTKSALFVFLIVLLFAGNKLNAQRGMEFGATGGASYYLGDLNLYKHFYSPHLSLGVFGKYHINPRYALRFAGLYSRVSGADIDFNNAFQLVRDREFESTLIEASAMFEVSFLPYEIGDMKRKSYTPYLHSGLAIYMAPNANDVINFAIPIGFGFKKNIKPRLVLGLEWTFRRTFSDVLDNVSGEDLDNYDPNYGIPIDDASRHKQIGFRYNKDWYSIANLTLSYTFKLGGLGCPAYYEWK
jgi:hypothetical protein